MLSPHEVLIVKACRNFGPKFFNHRLGPMPEVLLAAYRGTAFTGGKTDDAHLDDRQRASIQRARRDLSELIGKEWTALAPEERQEALERVLWAS